MSSKHLIFEVGKESPTIFNVGPVYVQVYMDRYHAWEIVESLMRQLRDESRKGFNILFAGEKVKNLKRRRSHASYQQR